MDTLDLQILSHLDADARRPFADLARELNVSQPTIADRVQRLEDRGILRGSMICLDHARLGYSISAFIRFRASVSPERGLIQTAKEMPQVIEMHAVTGEDCLVLRVVARSVEELGSVLKRLSDFGTSSTSIILETPIPLRNPIPNGQKPAEAAKPAVTHTVSRQAAKQARTPSRK